ncbi:uncharacterized protein LOC132257964 [Phlebotomus argentipes]|uniref:uncharacterized protein LOC132257964 n=1 Tax=Phlebotomus argentipes TaxID=94469 RepID=UPI0028936BEA|nr:uncharacterized protein LOC132257964 [Phlebotomus argentipes]
MMQQSWFILCLIIGIVTCADDGQGRKLSRRKRYLSFPEGSSLQVIYDQTIPIVALPLVFTVGVTVAIAYELPSKPLSELEADFVNKFDVLKSDKKADNTSKVDNINHISYISSADWKNRFKFANKHDLYYNDDPKIASRVQYEKIQRKKDPPQIYYENNRPNPWIESDRFQHYFKGNEDNKFSYVKKLASKYTPKVPKRKDSAINRSFKKALHRKHMIQPVFGKRSAEDVDDEEAQLHKMYHISTRHRLYGNIERYLEDKGLSGRECVLKSLCETRNNKDLPNTFMGAILKSIFRLPKLDLAGENDISEYMRAHHEVDDCRETYSMCKSNFWTSEFVK